MLGFKESMALLKYFSALVEELNRKSDNVRQMFSSHKPTAGDHRESSVAKLLTDHLPKRYEISSGLILSSEGEYSNQSDVIISDTLNNAPLFDHENNKIWLVESVYSVIEVKTKLTPTTLKDSIDKCQKFKKMNRKYFADHVNQRITDSLFVVWGFESAKTETFYNNYKELIKDIPIEEQPDFVLCPSQFLVTGGSYRKLNTQGQPGSPLNTTRNTDGLNVMEKFLATQTTECLELNDNSLIAFISWLSTWLQAAGDRTTMLGQYVANEKNIGRRVI